MSDGLLLILALLVCYVGFGWFALAKSSHWQQVRGAQPLDGRRARQLRVLGWIGLAVSASLCLAADHVSQAALVWVMALAVMAPAVAFTLSWRPALLSSLVFWIPR